MGLLLPNWEGVTSVPLWGPSPPLSPCPSQHTRWGHSLPAPRVGRRSEEVPGGAREGLRAVPTLPLGQAGPGPLPARTLRAAPWVQASRPGSGISP